MSYAEIKPSVLQVEIHPYLQQPNLVRFAQSLGIHVGPNLLLIKDGKTFDKNFSR